MDFKMYYIHLNVLPGLNKNKTKRFIKIIVLISSRKKLILIVQMISWCYQIISHIYFVYANL